MELLFLGRGAAFNPFEGNNSAYFIDNNQLFLIDCGESVFSSLMENKLLDASLKINLMITHTHSDHIGSLGSLVMYSYYVLHKSINIILPDNAKYIDNIQDILNSFGCTNEMYNYLNVKEFNNKFDSFSSIKFIETDHCDNLSCYGIIFETNKGIIYYSGDTRDIDLLKKIISTNKSIDKLYIDTTSTHSNNNAHIYIGLLNEIIPDELKTHVYCMHLNDNNCLKQALNLGFNVVEIIKK